MENRNKQKIVQIPSETVLNKSAFDLLIFKAAILQKNIDLLETVLHEQFIYFDDKNKWATLDYFNKQFRIEIPAKYYTEEVGMTFCIHCQPGIPALVFHKGYWPVPEGGLNSPKALRINFQEGLISDLTLCYKYCKTGRIKRFTKLN